MYCVSFVWTGFVEETISKCNVALDNPQSVQLVGRLFTGVAAFTLLNRSMVVMKQNKDLDILLLQRLNVDMGLWGRLYDYKRLCQDRPAHHV